MGFLQEKSKTSAKEFVKLHLKALVVLLIFCIIILVFGSLKIYVTDALYADRNKAQQAYVAELKKDQEQMLIILDDKLVDKKESILIQKVIQKIGEQHEKNPFNNSFQADSLDFIKQLNYFDERGYSEILNAKYKVALNMYFDEWIQDEQASIK